MDNFKLINKQIKMGRFFKIIFLFVFAAMGHHLAFSQKTSLAGLTFTSELTRHTFNSELPRANDFRQGVGLTFERQMTTHLGFETGLFYRTDKREFQLTVSEINYLQSVTERYLSLPLLLKFYSRFLNASVGPSVDYFVGWRGDSSSSNVKMTSYKTGASMYFGIMGKISKAIVLTDKIILEPEIRFNPIFKYNKYYAGIGIGIKYKL
jgi:hypothetical protein